jgi:hypothetical protein
MRSGLHEIYLALKEDVIRKVCVSSQRRAQSYFWHMHAFICRLTRSQATCTISHVAKYQRLEAAKVLIEKLSYKFPIRWAFAFVSGNFETPKRKCHRCVKLTSSSIIHYV